jgi:uncharacterized membrane protein YgaE (UPF0421/DUF939 family)
MKLGARILKTAIAVVVSLYVTEWFSLEPAFLVVLAAVIATQPSIYRSWQYILEQLQANTIGAVIGFVAVFFIGNEPLVIGIVVIVAILINLLLKFDKSIGLSIVTIIVIMEVPEEHLFTFGINRFLLILTGIIISVGINMLFIPPKYETKLIDRIKASSQMVFALLRSMVVLGLDEKTYRKQKDALAAEILKTEELYNLFKEERSYFKKKSMHKTRKLVLLGYMLDSLRMEIDLLDRYKKAASFLTDIRRPYADELKEMLLNTALYHEQIMMRYAGNTKTKPVMIIDEKPLDAIIMEPIHHHYNSLAVRLIELNDQLRRLDKFVTLMQKKDILKP